MSKKTQRSGVSEKANAGAGQRYAVTKIKYTDESIAAGKVVADFLPSPKELAFKEESTKVTLSLSKASVEFFKKEAARQNTQYQRMIRKLLDVYAEAHTGSTTKSAHR